MRSTSALLSPDRSAASIAASAASGSSDGRRGRARRPSGRGRSGERTAQDHGGGRAGARPAISARFAQTQYAYGRSAGDALVVALDDQVVAVQPPEAGRRERRHDRGRTDRRAGEPAQRAGAAAPGRTTPARSAPSAPARRTGSTPNAEQRAAGHAGGQAAGGSIATASSATPAAVDPGEQAVGGRADPDRAGEQHQRTAPPPGPPPRRRAPRTVTGTATATSAPASDADERRPAAAAQPDPVEPDEHQQRAGRVTGDVGGPRVRLEVEDPAGEAAQHGRDVGDAGDLAAGTRAAWSSRPARPRCQPSTSASASVQATAAA